MNHDPEIKEQDLRDPLLGRLGDGAALEGARRSALVARVLSAPAAATPRRRTVRWVWAPLAAAAIVVVAIGVWPRTPVQPTLPTDILGDLLGPLADMTPAPAPAPAATEEETDASPLSGVLAAVWGDLEGPLSIGLSAMEAPRAAASIEPTGGATRADVPSPDKEKEN